MVTVNEDFKENFAAPFLRWAGGKSWFARQIPDLIEGLKFERYHEPFLGGGAVFFNLMNCKGAFLSDANKRLIETYNVIKSDVNSVVSALKNHKNNEEYYYYIRSKEFECPIERAAQFIYLNQTSYNGIYRVNLKGKYNVPYGGFGKNFLDEKNLRIVSKGRESFALFSADFFDTIENIQKGDLVFLDPPYTVSHNKNGFIKYNEKLFSVCDQKRLSEYLRTVDSKGATYLMTNADHDAVRDIFSDVPTVRTLERANLIGGKQAKRGHVTELLFTNLEL